MGDSEKALEWLDRAVRLGDDREAYLRRNPLLKSLRAHPRFQQILDAVAYRRKQRRRRDRSAHDAFQVRALIGSFRCGAGVVSSSLSVTMTVTQNRLLRRSLSALLRSLANASMWRALRAARLGRAFDRRFGTDTLTQVAVEDMPDVPPELAAHAVQYEASTIPKFRRAMRAVERVLDGDWKHFSFVDFGSGKGLTAMLASEYPFRHVYGVEMSRALHEIALANLSAFENGGRTKSPVTLVCADAMTFPLPDDNLVAYLYNPFDAAFTAKLARQISDAAVRCARSVIVVYVNPKHSQVFKETGFDLVYEHITLLVFRQVPTSAGSYGGSLEGGSSAAR
jgi:predicted RNA methylase